MKQVIIKTDKVIERIHITAVTMSTPIFARKDGVLIGMILQNADGDWALYTGGNELTCKAPTRTDCVYNVLSLKYELIIDDEP